MRGISRLSVSSALFLRSFFIYFFATSTILSAQELPKTNLELFQTLTRSIVSDPMFLSALPLNVPVVVKVRHYQDSWFVRQSVTEALMHNGYQLFSDSLIEQTDYVTLTISPTQLSVVYGETFQDGLFTTRKTQRKCSVELNIETIHSPSKKVLFSKNFNETVTDTLPIHLIPAVEQSDIPSTQGSFPAGGILDRIVEPIVIIGAVGVAVVLFFTIRS